VVGLHATDAAVRHACGRGRERGRASVGGANGRVR